MARKTEAAPAATVEVKIVEVTPAQAKEWIDPQVNDVNRNIRPKLVNAYRRDMESGKWEFTAEPIQISRTGRLLNGQHRLMALATSKGLDSIQFVVATGLPDHAQAMMDQGKSRNARDALLIEHGYVKNVTMVAAVCRWLVLNPEVGPQVTPNSMRGKVTVAEVLEAFNQNPDVEEAAARAQNYRAYLPGSPTAIAYSWYAFHRVDPEACNEFFAGMMDMDFQSKNDPRKAALRRMQYVHRDQEHPTSIETGVMLISVLTRAWNAWRKGEEMESIMVKSRAGIIPPVKPV